MKTQNKIALVTGASTGIGRATAIELAKEGVIVFVTARNLGKLEETANLIEKEGGKSHTIVADLSQPESLNELIKSVKSRSNNLDILVNVAGIWHGNYEVYAGKDFETFDQSIILDTFGVGITAPILLAHAFIPLMPSGSSIINLSGTFENGAKGWLPYYVSKRAIEDFTIGLSDELKDKGIKVNCISPSDTATEEYKKYFPEDAAEAQSPKSIAKFVIELTQKEITGKVFVIKNGEIAEGFHK